jgi:pimeloyl-ACP methyl ester carboxylesterase
MSAGNGSVSTVVVHGLWMPGVDTWLLRRRLNAQGLNGRLYRYPSVRAGLFENAEALAEYLERVPGDTVHLVGHSLGGVVIVAMLQRFGCARPGRAVCLGSPLNGTAAGRGFASWPGGRHLVGRSIGELGALGGLPRWNGERPLGIVAGRVPLGFGSLVTRLPKPHDGVVAVEETRLAGADDHIVVDASHVALLWSNAAWHAVLTFLVHGRFAAEPAAG